ncbi:hypothetical protein BH11VER1_BH11VER1_01180 [soil metagenome]
MAGLAADRSEDGADDGVFRFHNRPFHFLDNLMMATISRMIIRMPTTDQLHILSPTIHAAIPPVHSAIIVVHKECWVAL